MHEMSLAQALVDQVAEIARANAAQVVEVVRLSIGELSGVDEEALRFCLPLAFEGTVLEGAVVEISRVPVEIECRSCGARRRPAEVDFRCVNCKEGDVEIVSGREFLLTSLEVT